ncbi:MAG: type II CRISPR RNA-guided endonuclease Cas9, partial [Brevinematales bacterium]
MFSDWLEKSEQEKEYILQILASQESIEKCKKTAIEKLHLDESKAELFASLVLEEGYCHLSLQAIKKLLPLMREGKTYPEAVKEVYGEFHQGLPVYDTLPPIDMIQAKRMGYDIRHIGSVTNPLVRRILTEARYLVNALVKRYGKPQRIFIELARDTYFTKKELEFAHKREKERKEAINELAKYGIANPSRTDIEKYLLAKECNWQCPYTGETITMDGLFGQNPEFQIEHIIPLSRSLDNSFANKTLCKNAENQRKHNKTPYEAYSHDSARYEEIKKRVKRFNGVFRDAKFERFCMRDMSRYEDFTDRLLNDTRYASKILQSYLAYLYGGLHVEGQPRRIFTTKGSITAYMRQYFGLAGIFGGIEVEGEEARLKKRDDH